MTKARTSKISSGPRIEVVKISDALLDLCDEALDQIEATLDRLEAKQLKRQCRLS
jgi:hypothetical protein